MKLAVLIQCHKNPEQINCLLNVMKNDSVDFYVHVDKKSSISSQIEKRKDIHLLPDEDRIDVQWGGFSQILATLNLLYAATLNGYDYYFLISGQDFPIQGINSLLKLLINSGGGNYIDLVPSLNNGLYRQNNYDKRNQIIFSPWLLKRTKLMRLIKRLWVIVTGGYKRTFRIFQRKNNLNLKFYFGSQWWCLNDQFIRYMLEYLKTNPQYLEFYKRTSCPDESFFQTLFMNSPYADTKKEYLHYIDWSERKSSPKNLSINDLPEMLKSGKFMARKINGDFELIDTLTKIISKETNDIVNS